MFTLRKPAFSAPEIAEWTLLTHPTLALKTWGKTFIPRTQTRVSVKPIGHLLVANALSVCNLVSALLSWVYWGSCFCFINVLFLSQRWWWWGKGQKYRGVGILRAYCSTSKLLGLGWGGGDVWLCVQCVIYKSDCTVFVLLCRKSVCIFSIKHSGFWKNNKGEAHGSLVGHVIVMAPESKVSHALKTHQSHHQNTHKSWN